MLSQGALSSIDYFSRHYVPHDLYHGRCVKTIICEEIHEARLGTVELRTRTGNFRDN